MPPLLRCHALHWRIYGRQRAGPSRCRAIDPSRSVAVTGALALALGVRVVKRTVMRLLHGDRDRRTRS